MNYFSGCKYRFTLWSLLALCIALPVQAQTISLADLLDGGFIIASRTRPVGSILG